MISESVVRLEGRWLMIDGQVVADDTCQLIERAVSNFVKLGIRDDGWTRLLRDPDDDRLWELTYPHSEMHGGGPPALEHLSREEVEKRYGKTVLL